jgi:hypothetical protein
VSAFRTGFFVFDRRSSEEADTSTVSEHNKSICVWKKESNEVNSPSGPMLPGAGVNRKLAVAVFFDGPQPFEKQIKNSMRIDAMSLGMTTTYA